jgi:hypothetical protein
MYYRIFCLCPVITWTGRREEKSGYLNKFTKTAQDAPRLQTGEEWASLLWGVAHRGETFVRSSSLLS